MKNFILLSAAAGLAVASPVQPEIESVFNHPEIVNALDRRAVPTKCDADNCARAVTGTANGLAVQSAHRDDCSSFFLATYIPPTTTNTITFTPHVDATVTQTAQITNTDTITLTETSYSDSLVNQVVNKRSPNTGTLIFPSAVPTYASACSGIARFSSACACWGIGPTTTTWPAPSVVETVTGPAVTDTHTQTVTQTAHAVAYENVKVGYVDAVLCGQTINTVQRHISYKIECGQDGRVSGEQYRVATSTQNDFSDCVAWVDSTHPYHAVAYSLSTKTCSAYSGWWTTYREANSDVVFAAHTF